jgi:acyl CoA:acetate/3-ketoacid CoA transferase
MQTVSLEHAVAMIPDGASLMVGGFMAVGTPERVTDEIVRQNKRNLTVVANERPSRSDGARRIASRPVRATRQLDDPAKNGAGHGRRHGLVTGAKRAIVAMQHTAKGKAKIVKTCSLPVTAARTVDFVVTEMAVIGFGNGSATLLETAPGVSVDQVVAATEAELVVPKSVPEMQL